MTAFLRTGTGGTIGIGGSSGSTINALGAAERGKPGQQLIPHPLNVIETIAKIAEPINSCDPQAQLQRAQQRLQQQVQQAITQQIVTNIQQEITVNASLQNIQQQMQSLQQQQQQGEDVSQQLEVIEKEAQAQMQKVIALAVARASQQMPAAAKVANAVGAGIKPVASVAESLANFVPSQGINMKNYGSTVKTVQTVSQSCFIG